jgi:hypothetical protein
MSNPLINPEEALAFLKEVDEEIFQTGAESKREEKRGPNTSPLGLSNTRILPSFEDKAATIKEEAEESRSGLRQSRESEWPDLDEVETVLSNDTDEVGGEDLKTVLRGLLKGQINLASYMEASLSEIHDTIETLSRKVEFLGVPSVLKVPVGKEKERPSFSNPRSELSTYFIPGGTPPTLKICRLKLVEISLNTPGSWMDVGEINSLDSTVLAFLQQNWTEGHVVAKISKGN